MGKWIKEMDQGNGGKPENELAFGGRIGAVDVVAVIQIEAVVVADELADAVHLDGEGELVPEERVGRLVPGRLGPQPEGARIRLRHLQMRQHHLDAVAHRLRTAHRQRLELFRCIVGFKSIISNQSIHQSIQSAHSRFIGSFKSLDCSTAIRPPFPCVSESRTQWIQTIDGRMGTADANRSGGGWIDPPDQLAHLAATGFVSIAIHSVSS